MWDHIALDKFTHAPIMIYFSEFMFLKVLEIEFLMGFVEVLLSSWFVEIVEELLIQIRDFRCELE